VQRCFEKIHTRLQALVTGPADGRIVVRFIIFFCIGAFVIRGVDLRAGCVQLCFEFP
jgi:hypothetical protein